MTQSGYDMDELFQEAQSRWLKPAEVLFILQNHEKYKVTPEPPQLPVSGSLFLFNKRILRFFRRDGHNWRKKRDGRTVGEAHERLKVGNVETLNCYYVHGEDNPNFQRRSYWILDPAYDHIVLVHYRDISEVRPSPGSFIQSPPVSSSLYSQSPISNTTQHPQPVSMISELHELYTSPGSVEVSSDIVIENNRRESVDIYRTGESDSSSEADVSQALRRLKEQLSLNDDSVSEYVADNPNGSDVPEFYGDQFTAFHGQDPIVHDQFYGGHSLMPGNTDDSLDILDYQGDIVNDDQFTSFHQPEHIVNDQFYSTHSQMQTNADLNGKHCQFNDHEYSDGNKESTPWKEVLSSSKASPILEAPETGLSTMDRTEKLSSSLNGPNGAFEYPSLSRSQEVDSFKMSPYPATIETSSDYFASFFEQGNMDNLGSDISLTVAQKQKFTIREISPEWGDADEPTKVIVIGSFLCDPSEFAWSCMFGDVEVPAEIIQEGVIRCVAPPHLPGKVTLCITSGNQDSCSEVRKFEYRVNNSSSSPPEESIRSAEEILLLVRFAQILLSDSSAQNRVTVESEFMRKSKADDDTWNSIIEALVAGSGNSSSTMYWLLEELLQDKLQQWLSSRTEGYESFDQTECSLSRKEQGMIHMIAGLGFEWALNPLLNLGVNINFRDINGWTALHWAARFGREEMVAVLVASGASAGAVTDPSCQDPIGITAASVAAIHGHKGLAGYLSEVALTSHLSSLTLQESEVYRDYAELEADLTMSSISKCNLETNEDPAPLENTLAAVRNASQAAAHIQSAFRAHSFRKRQQKEASLTIDDYGISSEHIQGLSALSKLNFRNPRDYNSAALSIQKKYRGWKGRKDYLEIRKKVVKIQAHVRGYQVRQHYKVICWAVGILDKVVLRWRRKGVGLRGFRQDAITEESEDEDILKVFRKQKVDKALKEAVSRVVSMLESKDAREQYQRILEKYHQAKAELGSTSGDSEAPFSLEDFVNMEDIDMYLFP